MIFYNFAELSFQILDGGSDDNGSSGGNDSGSILSNVSK